MRQRAFTIQEILLASALSLLLLTVLVEALLPLLRYSNWGYARAEIVQATARISARLVGDLQKAPVEAITLPSPAEPGLIGIHGIVGVTDTGRAIWDDHLIIYEWNRALGSLRRCLWNSPSTPVTIDAPYTLDLGQLRTALAQPGPVVQSLASGIMTDFSLLPSAPSTLPLKLRLVTQVAVSGRDPESYESVQEIYLRNGTR